MIYNLFLTQYQLTPDRIALVSSYGQIFTYEQVRQRVNQWANYLVDSGVGAGDRVGVLLDDEDSHYFILLALDRINACYVPFDTDIPKRQLTIDIATLHLKKMIIETTLTNEFKVPVVLALLLCKQQISTYSFQEPKISYEINGFEKILYLMSSSGSTGHKKWIPIMGAGINYWADTIKNTMGHDKVDPIFRFLSTRSPAFDARIAEVVLSLSLGAELHLLTRFQRKDLRTIVEVAKDAHIYCLLFVASQLNTEQLESILSDLAAHSCVSHLMVTGDACTPLLKALCEKYKINLWNCYGPTEATFGISQEKVNGLETPMFNDQAIVPIGKPYGHDIQCHVIEDILHIESPYLTPGYVDEAANQTAFKWITNQLGEKVRVFNTGDRVREQDGYLFYLGRETEESHCKISGVKVTSFYIEQHILNYNQTCPDAHIKASVVFKKHLGDLKPFAYLVTPSDFNLKAFLDYLGQHLRPEVFPILLRLDSLPCLSSDKIDKPQLRQRQDHPEDFLILSTQNRRLGLGPTEDLMLDQGPTYSFGLTDKISTIKDIWCELFQCDDIPLDAEFLHLGGSSILALEMISKINAKRHTHYSYISLLHLKTWTIRSVAENLTETNIPLSQHALIHPLVPIDTTKPNLFILPALLGEGHFSNHALAKRLAEQHDCNVYGLSEPGIQGEAWLPDNMDHAVDRYIRAIHSIQHCGPYRLLGFSLGATLAYEVATQLQLRLQRVSELHLVDGFPPYLYQSLPDLAQIHLLQSSIQFIVSVLTNRFYGEVIPPIKLTHLSTLSKPAQLAASFDLLEQHLKNPASKHLINVARFHLSYMLTAIPPKRLLHIHPTLYLSDSSEQYLRAIEQIPGISPTSSDRLYYFWTRYFKSITRCGITLETDHLDILRPGPAVYRKTADCYFERENINSQVNMSLKDDDEGPQSFYRFASVSTEPGANHQLSIFFMERLSACTLSARLVTLGIQPEILPHDQNLQLCDANDSRYASKATLFCTVPPDKVEETRTYMKNSRSRIKRWNYFFKETPPKAAIQVVPSNADAQTTGSIDLIVFWNNTKLMTLSFAYHALPQAIIQSLQTELHLPPVAISHENAHLTYHHRTLESIGGIANAFFQVEDFLADFIAVLGAHMTKTNVLDKTHKIEL
ncbi:MAG: AMP-binding protein [Gammaproteobacteria bacterium]|nr:AMP-binding protein [Gammaproteobacteria bacterium]